MSVRLGGRSNFIVSRIIILAFSCAGIFFAAQFIQQAAVDAFFRKISIPNNLLKAEGMVGNKSRHSEYLDNGYLIRTSNGKVISLHCGPWPSWDDCLSPKKVNYEGDLDNLKVIYYRDRNGNDGSTHNVIVRINDQRNFSIVNEFDQVKKWKKISREYDNSKGIYVAVEMDAAFWVIRLLLLWFLIILFVSAALSAKSLVSQFSPNKGNS